MNNTTNRLAILALPAAALGALFAVAGCAPSAGPDGPPPPVDGAPPVNPISGGPVQSYGAKPGSVPCSAEVNSQVDGVLWMGRLPIHDDGICDRAATA